MSIKYLDTGGIVHHKFKNTGASLEDVFEPEANNNPDAPYTWDYIWGGMPAYTPKNTEPMKKIILKFETEEDYIEFGERFGMKLTPRTKSVFYPPRQICKLDIMRWVDDSDPNYEGPKNGD